jgi:NCS1 family nucleobase:cation symporter-1
MIPSFATMPNNLGNALPTNDFICMLIFLLFSVIFYYLPVNTWRIIGPYAAMVTFIAFITIVAVCCSKAGGVGP